MQILKGIYCYEGRAADLGFNLEPTCQFWANVTGIVGIEHNSECPKCARSKPRTEQSEHHCTSGKMK